METTGGKTIKGHAGKIHTKLKTVLVLGET